VSRRATADLDRSMTTDVPPSMKEELGAWNNGAGIDLESWIGCEGRFASAVGYSTVFWPEIEEIGGDVLRSGTSEDSIRAWASQAGATRQSVEAMLNHLHLADIQHYGCRDCTSDKLLVLGRVLKEIYEAKLFRQFPGRNFCVSLHVPENPEDLQDYEITFWQVGDVAT
jgi:hypothetical protein